MDTHLAITATTTSGDLLTATAVGVHLGKRLATYRVGSPAATDACANICTEQSSSRVARKPRDRTCSVSRHTSAISWELRSTARRR